MSVLFDDFSRALAGPMPRHRALRITLGVVAASMFSAFPRTVHAADCGDRGTCSNGKCCSAGSTHCCPGDVHCCFNSGPQSVCCGLAVCCGPDDVCCPSAHGNGMANGGACCPAGSTCCGDTCCQSSQNQTCVNGVCVTASCDVLQARADTAAAQLMADNAVVSGMLDQIQNLSTIMSGMAPELTPPATQIASELTQLSAMYQDPSIDGGAYAAAAQAWALGVGVQELNQQFALRLQPPGMHASAA
jgi:hypothetical protein